MIEKMAYLAFYLKLRPDTPSGGLYTDGEKRRLPASPDFTVVPAEDVPDELKTILEAKFREPEMMISYRIGDYLYIIRGYGKQETGLQHRRTS